MGRFVQSIFDTYLSATAVPMLTQQQIGDAVICHPPQPEQIAISTYLDTEMTKLDALVAKVDEAVERLQEYRSALITSAVTGKIDVRKEIQA
jgi:restriction endonuclease S subunit